MLIAVHESWHYGMRVSARADDQEKNEDKRLEIEKGRLNFKSARIKGMKAMAASVCSK